MPSNYHTTVWIDHHEAEVQHLDRIGMKNHGVHPDVPKNVSKSITVD